MARAVSRFLESTAQQTVSLESITYRADIDGLRALSVLAVIAYHLNAALLPGGYVGVDVFFVISGYLISAIIASGIDAHQFTILGFYERRIRRIFPALFVMLFLVSLVAFEFLPPTPLILFANSAASAALSLSNVYFYLHHGYFDLGANELPLLHTWSLAVEEQFYLVFPAVFLFGRRVLRLSWMAVVIPLALASFLDCIVQTSVSSTAAFFLPFSRSWEFLLGAVLAVGVLPRLNRTVAETIGLIGLGLLAATTVLVNSFTPYPGFAALAPCLGAFLIIYSGQEQRTLIGRLIGLPALAGIGLISYSLYLWHWPVFVFGRLYLGGSFSALQSVVLLVGIFVVSCLSWRYVELPIRRNRLQFTRRRLFAGAAVVVLAFMGARFTANILDGLPQRFSDAGLRVLTDDRYMATTPCTGTIINGQRCFIGIPTGPVSFAVVGDSFAGALKVGLDAEARRRGRRGVAFIMPGCYPLIDVQIDRASCAAFMRSAFAHIAEMPHVEAVLLIGRWTTAVEGERWGSDNRKTGFLRDSMTRQLGYAENEAVLTRGMARTRHELQGRHLFIVTNIPEQRVNVPIAAAIRSRLGLDPAISVPSDIVMQRETRTRRLWQRLAATDGVSLLDVSKLLCDSRLCAGTRDGRSLYFDDNHLSAYGSDLIAQEGIYAPVFDSIAAQSQPQ
jgi:peptidoglycan/LPS O-acetylase OafA/YrhL